MKENFKDYELVSAYKDNESLRQSFNRMTNSVFGFDLEDYYQNGFWDDRYIPYSLANNGEIIANVSANLMELVIHGEEVKAIQIGTVMTDPRFRNLGLVSFLMNHVMDKYRNDHELFYLSAAISAVNFYPRLGFRAIDESRFTIEESLNFSKEKNNMEKLDTGDKGVLKFIWDFSRSRIPISNAFGVKGAENLVIFYCMKSLKNHVYFLKKQNAIIIYRREHNSLKIFDIISDHKIDFNEIISALMEDNINLIDFYFTPDQLNVKAKTSLLPREDAFFIKCRSDLFNFSFRSPLTAQA